MPEHLHISTGRKLHGGRSCFKGHAPPLHPRFFSQRASAYSARKIHGGRWMRRGSAGTFCTGRGQSGGLVLAPVRPDLHRLQPYWTAVRKDPNIRERCFVIGLRYDVVGIATCRRNYQIWPTGLQLYPRGHRAYA